MADPTEDDKKQKELEVLRAAFQAFNETTEHLQKSYETLQERIQGLNLELEQKNLELESNLREKEKVKNYLHNILESLTSGVIVVDENKIITTFSQTAGTILNLPPEQCLNQPLEKAVPHPILHTLVERLHESQKGNLIQDEELKNSEGRRITGPATLVAREADMNAPAEKSPDGQYHRARQELEPHLGARAGHAIAFHQQIVHRLLEQRKAWLRLQGAANVRTI